MTRTVTAIVVACATTALSGCASAPSTSPAESPITVFAASSLRSVFGTLGEQFEKSHPGTPVTFSFAGSADLATQLGQGAPADVFASADEKNMGKAVEAGQVTADPSTFATNTLTIVTAPGNPKGIASLADLAKPDISVVVCAPQVPCGSATRKVEADAGVALRPVSEESAVADVLGKVVSGQADAGLVYVTDAKSAGGKVASVPFPESAAAVNRYPIAVLAESKNPPAAKLFVDLVTGPHGRQALADAGFGVP